MDIDPSFLRDGLITFILLAASIVFHEWGHAVVADLLGDGTPRGDGRVTLNPMAHLDVIGTLVIPLVNIFVFGARLPFIGWGKPVITNPANLKNRWRDDILISCGGPAANLLLALVTIVIGSFVAVAQPRFGELAKEMVVINVGLAVFNMLPIPPLDGAAILRRVLGISEETYFGISRWSGFIMLFVLNFGASQRVITNLVALACVPYAWLCAWINPTAFMVIFRS